MKFQWDEGNLEKSLIKHGVAVSETESVWNDEKKKITVSRITGDNELRFLCVGMSKEQRLLTIIYTYRDRDLIRPISSRPANKKEKQLYYGF